MRMPLPFFSMHAKSISLTEVAFPAAGATFLVFYKRQVEIILATVSLAKPRRSTLKGLILKQ
ncbi:hypothetical protein BCEP4_140038 [Burkholderia cepacia]|nr:hypothetical protein BCEP4_140038 [Burkholderia cepacia]